MRILLLQDEIYLPSFGGGIKANRCLLEGLARLGHQCLALTPALTRSPDGPRTPAEFSDTFAARAIPVTAAGGGISSYEYRGVHVETFDRTAQDQLGQTLIRRIQAFEPDWLLVADDKRKTMLDWALAAAGDRVILLLQTIVQLPFGPLAVQQSAQQTERMAQVRAIVVISRFMQRYIETHSNLRTHLMRLPVYGDGPFPVLGRRDNRFVMMVNPCPLKGVSIFLALAREFPDVEFAAVPTWGAEDDLIRLLQELPNVCLLPPADDIDQLFAQARVLLVPSIWPETFGYVVPEAMLRGIPVLAADIGGLPEAKLGVDYLLPVTPAARSGNGYVGTPQNVAPWARSLAELLGKADVYERCSRDSREAALAFVSQIDAVSFETFLGKLAAPSACGGRCRQT
ncbi:MAG: glycosyltransferase family 4 protein [Planctomycetota bacterium]|nr:glycosyltransferase family 4 protein [Planctomycetota bacterium]